ncbi:LysM peptidoglycan-binding domain-containing protein [Thiomicrospira microaerophila]|uniref:LysM peptidoglycan-binding domain-containing protein n=1 Tax=Thiomicrospira microaerophila TaxID=406020 RepID=UPI0005CA9FC5|nr:LysM peptidoglycan-binding domain-containing protein [Thiomicrospira microaerophila]
MTSPNKNLIKPLALAIFTLLLTACQTTGQRQMQQDKAAEQAGSASKLQSDTALDRARRQHAEGYLIRTDQVNLDELAYDELIKSSITPLPFDLPATEPRDNLWDELADQFHLMEANQSLFQDYLAFYLNNKRHLERVSMRAQPYLHFIYEAIENRGMPYEIAMLPIIESAFYPYARSNMSAVGLWQFIPSTGKMFDLHQNWWFDGRQDVYLSTHAALDYLETLYERNNQDWFLALASYNAGYGRILQATARLKRADPNAEINYWNIRPYLPTETRHYVPQLLAVSYLIKHHEKYELNIHPIANEPHLTLIEIDRQIDLNKAAEMAGLSKELFRHLNPGYLKSITPPDGPHHLLIPLSHEASFKQQLGENSRLFDIQWARHDIKPGETLGGIAMRYKTSVNQIRQLNNLRGNMIRAGHTLLIPVPADQYQSVTQLAQEPSATQTSNTYRVHSVARGESLSTIAQSYGISLTDLIKWNNLNPNTPLQIAQPLKIKSDKFGHQLQHTVREGESLWRIARRYNVSVADLRSWNKLSNTSLIRPGTELTIWQSAPSNIYTVKHGDTIWDIARTYNVSRTALMRHNNLAENQFLRPGQILRIPGQS